MQRFLAGGVDNANESRTQKPGKQPIISNALFHSTYRKLSLGTLESSSHSIIGKLSTISGALEVSSRGIIRKLPDLSGTPDVSSRGTISDTQSNESVAGLHIQHERAQRRCYM